MKSLYNSNKYFFIGNKELLKERIDFFRNHYEINYLEKSFDLYRYYDNYIDFSKYQDCDKVINCINYAENKGIYFRNLNNFFKKNKINQSKKKLIDVSI